MDDETFRGEYENNETESYDNAVSPVPHKAEEEEVFAFSPAEEPREEVTESTEAIEENDDDSDEENGETEPQPNEVPESEPFDHASASERQQDDASGTGEEKSVSSDLIRGHINTIILRSLYDGDKYGYAIIAEIERKSHNQYQLKQPSLYSALKRLEKDGYITSYWGGSVSGGRRKYFSLTDEGKAIAERNQMEWEYSRTVIDSLISDRDFDFEQPAPSAVDMRVLKQSTSRVPSGEQADDAFDDVFNDEPVESEEDKDLQSSGESAEVAAQRAAFEAEKMKIEEELRAREEALRAEEEARNLREEEQARLVEELRRKEEELHAREEALHAQELSSQTEPAPQSENSEKEAEVAATRETDEQRQPVVPTTEQQPVAPTVEQQPVTQTGEQQPIVTTTEQQPATLSIEQQPVVQTGEQQPVVQTGEQQPVVPTDGQQTDQRYWNEWRAIESARLEEEAYLRLQAEAAAKARYEEELRRRQEAEQLDEQRRQKEQEYLKQQAFEQETARIAAEETQRKEAEQLAKEQALREQEARLRAEEARLQEERARVLSLNAEKEQQNARILEMQSFAKEREQYERAMQEREAVLKEQHQLELAEQEKRIRREVSETYRQREQEILHNNYLDLVQNPRSEAEKPDYSYYNGGAPAPVKPDIYATKPQEEREYRSIIQKIYTNAITAEQQEEQPPLPVTPPTSPRAAEQAEPVKQTAAPAPAPKPVAPKLVTPPAPPAKKEEARSLDGIDFYDLETRASQDGIRITTSGNKPRTASRDLSLNLVHKGKALFVSALVVFLICLAEGSISLALLRSLSLPRVYPFLIWGAGLAVLIVSGLAYLNHYGERSLRQTGNLLVTTIFVYALCIVAVSIVAIASQIDFGDFGILMTYVIIPIVFLLNIVIFAAVYHLQIKPKKD